MSRCMKAAFLPGNSTVEMRDVPVPEPGPRRSAASQSRPLPSAGRISAPSITSILAKAPKDTRA